MNTPPKQSDTDLVEKLSGFDTATVANAIEHFKVRDPVVGYASLELRAQISNPKPMVGYAVTCTKTTTSPGDKRPQGLEKVLDLIDNSRKPAVLVFQYLGGVLHRASKNRHRVGVLLVDVGFQELA